MDSNYYLGLDMGTNSVGWAVTDMNYKIQKFKGNAMWGIRLFDESNTAQERRAYRSSRRRTQRKRERLSLLEMLFDAGISKIDPSFFMRLRESNLYPEDKSASDKYCVFSDKDYTDKDFHHAYPTIYHLRNELIINSNAHDVRLVYIALHHIIKNRGNFLFDSIENAYDFSLVYENVKSYILSNYDVELKCSDIEKFKDTLKNKHLNKTNKNKQICELFGVAKSDKQVYSWLTLLSGSSVKLCNIFDDDELADVEKKSITFSGNYEDNIPDYLSILGERFELIEKLKTIYDWAILADILNGKEYISQAKVDIYEQHKKDLKLLKEYVKAYLPEEYKSIFAISKSKCANYVAYSGHLKKNSGNGVVESTCNQEEFCDYLKKTLGVCEEEKYADMFARIENKTFMPKQVNKDNGVIPMQIHEKELKAILNNAEVYLPFLSEKDDSGKTISEKIIALFEYRIPYYVGPLNTHSKKAWIVRSEEKIYPWNFAEVVDTDKSAEAFITNLTSKCTYLPDKDVIPKNSILYSKFMVLNELNNLKLDGEKIDVSLKQDIFNDLFKTYNKVTNKKLRDYLKAKGISFEIISGIDKDFKSSLKSYLDLKPFNLSEDEKEEIIRAITIFGDDKKLLKKRLRANLKGKLTEEELLKIFRLKYSGWSNLSKEFLSEVECTNKETGEVVNIISSLWDKNDNLMQLLYSENYQPTFNKQISNMNRFDSSKSINQMVDELYVSPKVKRPIKQSLLIAKEIEKIMKCPPKKIFVEVAREDGIKKRTVSRKTQLLELYKTCKKGNEELFESLNDTDESRLRKDKLYLYYTQFGKCMYSGEPIDLKTLLESNSKYDIDHIFPKAKIKDDSLDNRVLVNKTINANKTNDYPLNPDIQSKMTPFWSLLLSKELISKKKYERLVRITPLSDHELSDFISRQLVETRQSTKAVANILEQLYPSPDTKTIYVKASLASELRTKLKMFKSREVNDLHHAKDAYLNIVAGNVYHEKFTSKYFITQLQQGSCSLKKMYDYPIANTWVTDNDESIKTVKKTMNKNNILYTRYSAKQQGGLFDQNILKKGKGQVSIKQNCLRSDIEKYGGYNKASSAYFSLIEYPDKKGKLIRALVPIDTYQEKDYLENPTDYLANMGYPNAKVIISTIKYNSCLSFNGFRMHISKKMNNGTALGYKPAMQLVLGYKNEDYIKKIEKYTSQFADREINKYDNISAEENIELYDLLLEKLNSTIFKEKFTTLSEQLTSKRDVYLELNMKQQCFVLLEILKILHCNVLSGDLTLLNEAKNAGIAKTNNRISEIKGIKSVKLINQSVTGLFEKEIDLLN